MTWKDIVWEEASKLGKPMNLRLVEHIIWEETGFPEFFHIPKDGKTPEECFRKQVRDALSG